jgi:hypothetical protein
MDNVQKHNIYIIFVELSQFRPYAMMSSSGSYNITFPKHDENQNYHTGDITEHIEHFSPQGWLLDVCFRQAVRKKCSG